MPTPFLISSHSITDSWVFLESELFSCSVRLTINISLSQQPARTGALVAAGRCAHGHRRLQPGLDLSGIENNISFGSQTR